MKKRIFFGLLFMLSISSFSQNLDLVVTTSGDSIACKIDSITESSIYLQIKIRGNVNWIQTLYDKKGIHLFKYGIIDSSKYNFVEGTSKIEGSIQPVYQKKSAYQMTLKNASNEDLGFYLAKANKTKKIGAVMSIAGPLAASVGLLLAAASINTNPFSEDVNSSNGNFGAGLFFTGIGVTIVGLPILISGSSRVKKINEMKKSRGMTMEFIPGGYYNHQAQNYQPGATVRIRF